MTPDRFRRVEEIFNTASRMARGPRTDFITRECSGDPSLQTEVEALLEHDEQPANYLRTPVLDAGLTLRDQFRRATENVSTPMPQRIGSYRPLEVIGEGGFGVVYLAEQEMPRRTVAIKVIRPGLATRAILKRFEYEAQILGRLHHPYIAQIYEAGMAEVEYPTRPNRTADISPVAARPTVSGRQAFVAMEYIRGKSLHEYAKDRKLAIRDRLELVARICEGIQHAHQKGIIHRDLKPANILVVANEADSNAPGPLPTFSREPLTSPTLIAPRLETNAPRHHERPSTGWHTVGTPKILDFGVARAADPELSSTTVQTDIGQMIGTLPYMSPEQVIGDPNEIDTRSDVYALGVILYELLAGRLPYDIGSRSIPDAARIIRDQPPTRLSSLNRHLRGEVEIIVSKALEKDKTRRYQSAAELGEDLRCYLAGEPIAARRDSALYVLRKQLRRYWGVAAVAILFVLLLAGFGAFAWSQSRAFEQTAMREHEAKLAAIDARGAADRARGSAEESLTVAQEQRQRADEYAARLAAELTVSNIERGRLAARTGNMLSSENLLWREHAMNPTSPYSFWALWELYSRAPWLVTIRAHEPDVTTTRFTPDSKLLITGGGDGLVRLWDCSTWRCSATMDEHRGRVVAIEVHPYSRMMATLDAGQRLIAWDLPSGRVRYVRETDCGVNPVLAFSPDGRWFATGGVDRGVVAIWDPETGDIAARLPIDRRGAAGLAFSPLGQQLAASVRDGTIRIFNEPWDPPPQPKTLRPRGGSVASIAYSADGNRIFVGGMDRVLRAMDIDTNRQVASPQSPNDTIGRMRMTPDGRRLATGGYWTLNLWNPSTCEYERSLSLAQTALSFDFSADGRFFAYGSGTGQLRVLQLKADDAFVRLDGHETRCTAAMSDDGKTMAVGDVSGAIQLWDVESRRKSIKLPPNGGRVRSVAFEPNGRRLATESAGVLRIWDLQTESCIDWFPGHASKSAKAVVWSRDGRWLADTTLAFTVRVIDADTMTEVGRIPHEPGELLSIAFSNDGEYLAVVVRDRTVRIWTRGGQLASSVRFTATPWTASFNVDDSLLAVGAWDHQIHVFDWRSADEIATLEGHTATAWGVAFHPRDPGLLVSSAADGTVRLWDVYENRCLIAFEELQNSEVLSVAFSADGTRILAANSLGVAAIWNLTYFEKHIAGQIEYQIERLGPELGDRLRGDELRKWAAELQP